MYVCICICICIYILEHYNEQHFINKTTTQQQYPM